MQMAFDIYLPIRIKLADGEEEDRRDNRSCTCSTVPVWDDEGVMCCSNEKGQSRPNLDMAPRRRRRRRQESGNLNLEEAFVDGYEHTHTTCIRLGGILVCVHVHMRTYRRFFCKDRNLHLHQGGKVAAASPGDSEEAVINLISLGLAEGGGGGGGRGS